MNAFDNAALGPARAARMPPVANPLIIAFHGSSLRRIEAREQSQQLKSVPQMANDPPKIGVRALTRIIACDNM